MTSRSLLLSNEYVFTYNTRVFFIFFLLSLTSDGLIYWMCMYHSVCQY